MTLLFPVICFAQYNREKMFNVELGVGGLYSFDKMIFDKVHPGLVGYAELRYNLKRIPLSLGLDASVQIFKRSTGHEELNYYSSNIMIVSDYSFYRADNIKLYAGFGVGTGSFEETENVRRGDRPGSYTSSEGESLFCFMPRVGIEMLNHFRVSMGYLFEDAANRNLYLRVGYSF